MPRATPRSKSPTANEALDTLTSLPPSSTLSILKLSEPISTSTLSPKRTSDISSTSLDAPTPASLDADLSHYRELFAKLRFSYVEQVTKEKFIRAIVGDPPLIVTPAENLSLERANQASKAALKDLKTRVAATVCAIDAQARELAGRHEAVARDTARLEALPTQIRALEARVLALRAADQDAARSDNAELNLPLPATAALVEQRKRRREELDRAVEGLQAAVPRKRKEMERLEHELGPVEARRTTSVAAAREARRRKEEAKAGRGTEDDLEERGRWYRGCEGVLRGLLEV